MELSSDTPQVRALSWLCVLSFLTLAEGKAKELGWYKTCSTELPVSPYVNITQLRENSCGGFTCVMP